jgi:hypothetical protein
LSSGFPEKHPGSTLRFDKPPHIKRSGARPIVASFYLIQSPNLEVEIARFQSTKYPFASQS